MNRAKWSNAANTHITSSGNAGRSCNMKMNFAEYFMPLLSPQFPSIFTYSLLICAPILNAALLMLILAIRFNQQSVTPFGKRNYILQRWQNEGLSFKTLVVFLSSHSLRMCMANPKRF